MYYVAGSNLFGQWLCDDVVINNFRMLNESRIDLKEVKIVQINWSYNILLLNNELYASGAWGKKERQLTKILLPPVLNDTESEYIVVGNDYIIVFVSMDTFWVMNLKNNEFKKLSISEGPIDNDNKKPKIQMMISKVFITNDACLYLTANGNVYSGILPSLVDTRHCIGKVCDIQCGYEHFVLLTDLGKVYSWGNGRRLQLGHGDVSNLDLPTELDALAGIRISKIATGGWHTLALSEFGDLYAWGWNDTGQLGIRDGKFNDLVEESEIKDLKSYSVPTLLDILDDDGNEVSHNVIDVACGSKHTAIMLKDGSVWTTGSNKYGQLGFSNEKYPKIDYFKKAFQINTECSLICGPWSTVIDTK